MKLTRALGFPSLAPPLFPVQQRWYRWALATSWVQPCLIQAIMLRRGLLRMIG